MMNRRKFLWTGAIFVPAAKSIAQAGLRSPAFVGGLNKHPSGSSYLVEEDCESGSTPSGWTDSGAVEWNYATAPAPLAGSYSFRANGSTESTVKSFTAQSEVWAYLVVNITGLVSSPYAITLRDSSDANLIRVRFMSDGAVRAYNSTGSASTAAGVVASGTTYSVWIRYVKGTGSNSISQVWISSTTTKPGSVTVEKTDGSSTTDASKFFINPGVTSADLICDTMRAASFEIGSNPT